MARIRTFVDSGVLIAAFKGAGRLGEAALSILEDANRDFISSDFVRLEVLPKPICYGRQDEFDFYETFFASVRRMIHSSRKLVQEAQAEAEFVGLSAVDALHVAAAKRGRCDELVTTERPEKPLFRVSDLAIITICPAIESAPT